MSLAIDIFVEKAESEVDQALNAFVQDWNTVPAVSGLSLHRRFGLTERGLRRITEHADKTRRQLKIGGRSDSSTEA